MMNNILMPQPEAWTTTMERCFKKPSISVTFQVTENCCMACTYCYQHLKTDNKMTFDVAKTVIDKLLNNELGLQDNSYYATLSLEFIGGEPLLEIDLIEQIYQYTLDKMIEMQHPWLVGFRGLICSNAILYNTSKVQEFFQIYSNFIDFTVSIDGNKELHDSCRIDLNGNGTYDKVLSAIKHYREHYGELLNTKMTISQENIYYLYNALISLIKNGFTEIFVNCVFEKGWDYSHAKILYSELKKVADYLINNNLYNKIFIRFFNEDYYQPMNENKLNNWCGGVLSDTHSSFAVDYKGDIYPCLRYMNSSLNGRQKPIITGNIYSGYASTNEHHQNIELISNITRRSQSTDECFYCPIAEGCAWCSGYNYEEFGTPNKRATYICCMHQATSLANVYFLNKLYKHLNIDKKFKMYLPKDKALNIINEQEYNYLLKLSQEEQ